MDFTYAEYGKLLNRLLQNNYKIANYSNWNSYNKCAILRHDIDTSIEKAVELGSFEKTMGVTSTYFVLLTSDFYNVMAKNSVSMLKQLVAMGHDLGLHFDTTCYDECMELDELKNHMVREAKILSEVLETEILSVSMHRPSQMMLESDIDIPGLVNSYGKVFFKDFKYVSDSRMHWREPVEEIIDSNEYNRLHILTHAFWYSEEKSNIHDVILNNIEYAKLERYCSFCSNITRLDELVKLEEVKGE